MSTLTRSGRGQQQNLASKGRNCMVKTIATTIRCGKHHAEEFVAFLLALAQNLRHASQPDPNTVSLGVSQPGHQRSQARPATEPRPCGPARASPGPAGHQTPRRGLCSQQLRPRRGARDEDLRRVPMPRRELARDPFAQSPHARRPHQRDGAAAKPSTREPHAIAARPATEPRPCGPKRACQPRPCRSPDASPRPVLTAAPPPPRRP